MNRSLWISLTALGCGIGAFAGHQLGRSSVTTVACPAPTPAPTAPSEDASTPAAKETSPPPETLVADIVTALKQRDRDRYEQLTAAMEQLDDDALRVAIDEAAQIFNRDERRAVTSGLLAALAKRDAEAALGRLRDMTPAQERFQYARPVFMAIIDTSSPENALALYHQQRFGSTGQLGISSLFPIFSRLGHEDIDAAIAATSTIQGGGHRRQMISSLCESATDPAKREELIGWADTLTDTKEQAQAFGDIIEIWARRETPEAALAWTEQSDLPPPVITEIEQDVSTIKMAKDPQAAAEWLLARATNENRADHLAFAVEHWARNAPNAAGRWLGQQTLDATADRALARFADVIAREDPESAHAWANRITDPDQRANTLQLVMMHWRRIDPAAAAAAP